MTRIGIITSSTRPARIGPTVAAWVAAQAPDGVETEIVDLGKLDLPFLRDLEMPAKGLYDQPTTLAWAAQVAGYDAVLFVLAQYNASYPAPVKNAIDTLYREWEGKPVGLVGYGFSGATAAIDHLSAVLRHVKATLVADSWPQLFLRKNLGLDGTVLDGAPADQVRELFDELVAAAHDDWAA